MRQVRHALRRTWVASVIRTLPLSAFGAMTLAACAEPSSRDTGTTSATDAVHVTFDAPRAISAMSVVGAAPILAIAPDGARATAWVSAPDGGTDGRLHVMVSNRSATPGDSASVARVLTDALGPIEPHGEAPPKLAWVARAGGGHTLGALYVVGRVVPGRRFPVSALRFVRSDDNGNTWSAPVTVTDDTTASVADGAHFGSHNFHALHGAPDGTFHVAWLDGRAGKSAVYTTHSVDGGQTWAPNVRVVAAGAPMTEACPCCRTAIAADRNGTVYLAWRAVLDADTTGGTVTPASSMGHASPDAHAQHGGGTARTTVRDIVVSRSSDRGQTWSAPIRVHHDDWVFDGCPHAGPSMAIDDAHTLHVAWWTGKPGAAGVYYTQSRDNGATFAPATPLGVAKASQPAHVQLAVMPPAAVTSSASASAARILVTWDDGTLRVPQVVMRTSGNGGRSFGEAMTVSEAGPAAAFPVLAVDAAHNTVMVAWSQQAASDAQAATAARPDMKDPRSVMPLPRVGNTQVLLRTGVIDGARTAQADPQDAFAPVAVGDAAPSYGVRVVHGAFAGDSLDVATPGAVTLLNVWATWCTSCREEMADLDTLHRTYAARGLRVVAVSVDQGSPDRVTGYVAREKLSMSIAHDPANRVQSLFGVVGVPETYLIDGTGRVVWKTAGNIHGALPGARTAIEAALKQKNANIMPTSP